VGESFRGVPVRDGGFDEYAAVVRVFVVVVVIVRGGWPFNKGDCFRGVSSDDNIDGEGDCCCAADFADGRGECDWEGVL